MVTPALLFTQAASVLGRAACLALAFHALAACAADAEERVRGLPFSRTYSLEDIGYVPRGSRLNFDSYGRIAVIHDGVYAVLNDTAWINIAHADESTRTPMSDVVHAGYGRAYYAGRASWGMAEFGPDGALHARSLVPPDPPAWTRTTTFDQVIVTTAGVYFSSARGIVFWDFADKQCQLHEAPRSSRSFVIGQRVFVASPGLPLRYVDVKERALHPCGPSALDGQTVDLATTLDSGRALVSLTDGRMFVYDGQQASPWPAQGQITVRGRLSVLRSLADGNVALAANGEGVFIVSPEGELISSLTTPAFHRVASIASRENGVLWVLTEDSIEKVLYRGGLTSFGQRQGLTLFYPSVAKVGDRTYVATARTLYHAVAARPRATARFERVDPQPPGGALQLTAAGPHLLVGNGNEIFARTPTGGWERIAQLGGLAHLVMIDARQCYAIGTSGLALLEWDGARWTEPVPRIAGLAHAYGVHRTARGVWIEMSGDGVARVGRKGDRLELTILRNEEWTKALWVNIGVVGDTVVLSPIGEPRRFFDEQIESWCQRPQLAALLDSSARWLSRVWQDEKGTLWAAHREGLVRFTPSGEGYTADRSTYDLINDRYPELRVLPGNDLWVTASRSLHHVEDVAAPVAPAPTPPVLVSLMDTRRNVELPARRLHAEPLRLAYGQNSLAFRFFSGSYGWRRAPSYEFRLNASEPWTTLETGSLLPFPNLRDGKYQLQVRVADDRATPVPALTFAFEILPPWHRTWPAYAGFATVLLLGVLGVTRWSGLLERRRNRVLEEIVRERTRELESTMRKLNEETRVGATLAERDRLAGEIHDSVQQGLSGAILQLDTTLKQPHVPTDLRGRLAVVRNMVSYARQEVQHTVWDMASPLLEGNDLGEALRKLTGFTASSTLVPTVAVNGTPVDLPRRTTHHLLRIAQEATTNAVRHAAARNVCIRLDYGPEAVALTITDDGAGFRPDDALSRPGHFGLTGMRGRAKSIGGDLTIRSGPGEGTSIRIAVPLPSLS